MAAVGGRTRPIAIGLIVVVFVGAVLASMAGSGDDDRDVSDASCDALLDDMVSAYTAIIQHYEGKSLEQFAAGGFLAEGARSAAQELSGIEGRAEAVGCDPWTLLARLIARGNELAASGPGGVAAKGMLLATAANAVLYGPGSQNTPPPELTEPREPTNIVSLEKVLSISAPRLASCKKLAAANAVYIQWLLNEIARVGRYDRLTGSEAKPVQRAIDRANQNPPCRNLVFNEQFIAAMERVEAVGFNANVAYSDYIKQAWLEVQDRLVNIEIDFTMQATPEAATVGDEVRITYTVTNNGTVPLSRIELTDEDLNQVVAPIDILDAGDSVTASEEITVTADDVPRREIRVQLNAQDPFGRVTGIGFQSIFVRVDA